MTSAEQPAPEERATDADIAAVEAQLGRPPRGVRGVAHRCPCGLPDVVRTAPRLEDGTPFPTTYYLTCPRAASAIGTLEAGGLMREMTRRLDSDPELRAAYRKAHDSYVAERAELARADGVPPLPEGMQSAGGMPTRVKCLHALVGHELASPGTNPFGREALDALPEWWAKGPCVHAEETTDTTATPGDGK
ncbi:hypothetical protein HDA32_000694 [Spinactinospora alkalitolerans]|uniref:DUF501 domain-containing protein n=1 Tax=Spinactinospora alkalitolerans TaxID=687207 RepID=A0A852TTX3_9ACTN|nr:DUF501 domain-containing protein [Spinactinospora alkalitolerans]NYE45574.1 hypothetical protein [Spinactinospora alkalitolerans]